MQVLLAVGQPAAPLPAALQQKCPLAQSASPWAEQLV
jgi:hypothetical protein